MLMVRKDLYGYVRKWYCPKCEEITPHYIPNPTSPTVGICAKCKNVQRGL